MIRLLKMKNYLLICFIALLYNCNTDTKAKLRDNPDIGNKPRLQKIMDLKNKYKASGIRSNSIFLGFYLGMSYSNFNECLNRCINSKSLIPYDITIRDTIPYSQFEPIRGYEYNFHVADRGESSKFYDFKLKCILEPKFYDDKLYELSISFWGFGYQRRDGNFEPKSDGFEIYDFMNNLEDVANTFDLKYGSSVCLFNVKDEIDQYYWIINNLEVNIIEEKRDITYNIMGQDDLHTINEPVDRFHETNKYYCKGFKIVYRDYFTFDQNKSLLIQNAIDIKNIEKKRKEIDKKNQQERQLNEMKNQIRDI